MSDDVGEDSEDEPPPLETGCRHPFLCDALKNAFAAMVLCFATYDDISGMAAISAVSSSPSIGSSVEPCLYFLQNCDHIDELEINT